jgi:hypothetical protein
VVRCELETLSWVAVCAVGRWEYELVWQGVAAAVMDGVPLG